MEPIKHECGIVMLRLLKPLSYYKEKYGTDLYGLNKLYLMMEKEHNRGQEGAGIGCVKMDALPGREYIFRERAEGSDAIHKVFEQVHNQISGWKKEEPHAPTPPFIGEVYMGHLRYSTTGRSGISNVHPFMRRNNWCARNMLLCGNFNLTNVDEIFNSIVALGQHPRYYADGFILLEQLGHALDRENERMYKIHYANGLTGLDLSTAISRDIDISNVLHRCAPSWDGGYVMCGIAGNGDMWTMRDPSGIRPAFYYCNDEVIVVASERPVIQTAFNLEQDDVKELMPGSAIVVDRNATYKIDQILRPKDNARCSFERIYFSRGNDGDIYHERKALGALLVDDVCKAVDNDIDHTVLSFIPNTAEVAYMGMAEEFGRRIAQEKFEMAKKITAGEKFSAEEIEKVMLRKVRNEKIAWKDIKLRTFIAQGDTRNDLAAHVYDITYGSITPGVDNLVVIDDSIVRGTTLRQSIIKILDRLHPHKIVIVSSSPQVRYPDCYGIDMSRLGEFIAFRAAMELLKDKGMLSAAKDVYDKCVASQNLPKEQQENHVKAIYAPFTDEEVSTKIAEMLTPEDVNAEVKIVYQSVENMHKAIPNNPGDWYFSGDYPTAGGNKLVNKAFINYYEGHPDSRVD
jgi:amidophosphoribosyltransferase